MNDIKAFMGLLKVKLSFDLNFKECYKSSMFLLISRLNQFVHAPTCSDPQYHMVPEHRKEKTLLRKRTQKEKDFLNRNLFSSMPLDMILTLITQHAKEAQTYVNLHYQICSFVIQMLLSENTYRINITCGS